MVLVDVVSSLFANSEIVADTVEMEVESQEYYKHKSWL